MAFKNSIKNLRHNLFWNFLWDIINSKNYYYFYHYSKQTDFLYCKTIHQGQNTNFNFNFVFKSQYFFNKHDYYF
jgi:hypothetical protein